MENFDHSFYMSKCIELAKAAKLRGDSPVGSILVMDGKIVGEGIEGGKTFKDITFHSEIEAIRNSRALLETADLSNCIMYTTHEPCIMCSYVIRHHKINTIIIGLASGEIGGFSSIYPVLKDTEITKWENPPVLLFGILEEECRQLSL
ncbi:nucleoside deaminase [Flavobacterium sp. MC2016-06]|jgi:tRNA(adenine34) deaminase|uniref:nucleoside deaminase n=1 Tax=Flavobacterium sp. MC2016-06 TaxID=2676308 RepID=UPI0012BB054B|nr:nucleoside deaminase [Flavobacterium sp. MC2016-06]MBU3857511.1 nucleoside deaminase [Flavobacterium sp. MC2016-06]